MIIGLTGGMGCGKSTATRFFVELGFSSIDSDAIVREQILTAPETAVEAKRLFGASVLTSEGVIDRAALAREIFQAEDKLHAWEQYVHPRLYQQWRSILDKNPERDWIIEVPLLHEKQLEKWFDFVVCVASTSARQFARLSERGFTHALAEQRISKQLPLATKLERADFVLSNDGTPRFLRDQIARLITRLAVAR